MSATSVVTRAADVAARAAAVLGVGAGVAGCAAPPAPVPAPADGPVWTYEVRVSADFELDVEAMFRARVDGPLRVDREAAPFVGRTADADGRALGSGAVRCEAPCRVRYRFHLREAAERVMDLDTALAAGGAVFAPPSTWLLRPEAVPRSGRYRFHVTTPAGMTFVTGVRPAPAAPPDTYEADVGALEEASFAGFGALRVHRVGEPAILAAIAPSLPIADDVVLRWTRAEVDAIARYLGGPPDDRAVLFVVPGAGRETHGMTYGDGGAAVFLRVGVGVTPANVLDDWVLAHELVHVGAPNVGRAHAWFGEGLATYVEPVARARAGLLPVDRFWSELVEGLPRGLPRPDDGGLDRASGAGRIYWGGALYFLLADLAIRERTGGARSLDDVVRAWRAAGASAETRWPLDRAIDEGDRATGTGVLRELHQRLATTAVAEDLPALFARLGVRRSGEAIAYDDAAPLAAIRRAITAAPPR